MLELIGLGSDAERTAELAATLGGVAYRNHRTERDSRPYSAMLRVATDNHEAVRAVSDVALYVGYSRIIKPLVGDLPPDRSIATFGMVRHAEKTHRECDDYWRDGHGPLALQMHLAMCDYTQLSIIETLHGDPLDGIAMCAFPTRDDLSTKFFNDDAAKAAILEDVVKFSNPAASPPRVVLQQLR